jgi:ABC-type cobalamin/Fe3+-siderophores transport system ATPase subunit
MSCEDKPSLRTAIQLLLKTLSYKQYCGYLLIFGISFARFYYIKFINDISFELYKLVILTLCYLIATHIVQNVIHSIMHAHLNNIHDKFKKLIFNFGGQLTPEEEVALKKIYDSLKNFDSFSNFIVLVWTHGVPFIIIVLMKSIIEIVIITILTILFIYILNKIITNEQKKSESDPYKLPMTISCGLKNDEKIKELNFFQKNLSKILMCLYTIIVVVIIAMISNDRIIIQNFLMVSWMILVISDNMKHVKNYDIVIEYFKFYDILKENQIPEHPRVENLKIKEIKINNVSIQKTIKGKNPLSRPIKITLNETPTILFGNTGCGKTTIFNSFFQNLMYGNIMIEDCDLSNLSMEQRCEIIYYFKQNSKINILPKIQLEEYLELMKKLELTKDMVETGACSGGESARLGIFIGLTSNCSVLFFDEPLASQPLDKQVELLETIIEYGEKYNKIIAISIHTIPKEILDNLDSEKKIILYDLNIM